jgi:hypothetical protein
MIYVLLGRSPSGTLRALEEAYGLGGTEETAGLRAANNKFRLNKTKDKVQLEDLLDVLVHFRCDYYCTSATVNRGMYVRIFHRLRRQSVYMGTKQLVSSARSRMVHKHNVSVGFGVTAILSRLLTSRLFPGKVF